MTITISEKAAVVLYKVGFFSGPEQQFIDNFQEQ